MGGCAFLLWIDIQEPEMGKMTAKIEIARKAFAAGQLANYKPLASMGSDSAQATATASWGPAMRR
ncbi:MAG: hypothetical protein VR74_05305 [Hyphomonas sp. BRH_c22]|nr:MAG: hypothetical protein VR74_05305 [Hyphomonas sp. BRH_c22]